VLLTFLKKNRNCYRVVARAITKCSMKRMNDFGVGQFDFLSRNQFRSDSSGLPKLREYMIFF
jgi:hypothetical protein